MTTANRKMFETVSRYFASCNAGDSDGIIGCLTPDAVHYFPGWAPVRGAKNIAALWVKLVGEAGSQWTIDKFLAGEAGAVIEWTHFRTKSGKKLRGSEWYTFDADWRISELKAYYAAPHDPNSRAVQLRGYPYKRRGYPMKSRTTPSSRRGSR
jgi:hypothetical protein